ncbi:class I SAM-dependent methyltransferase [Microbulbifer hydrolyticus]|uniref:Cyclopropane fatty-acyl-phospholipid synthase-like methyltransferase n=1 Tax=Microbulbifer hydrolyticus TaxID=48074 RepID=A0A6P1TDR7_9GAMM|nr:class I SAM-dependent methyltransferase [Microbulbifer hydrolyticus]MBB5210689.1 cyclopropane fatty-acyl-phospholipid synthase-like methyltransferase [Microbulbifer hydrolyticus]QHQ38852.1 methyltransferase domain-containing protein [Microbulbifer hydrolyticus]
MSSPEPELTHKGSSGSCPLCRQSAAQFYHRDKFRDYYQCARCALVFVPPAYHLSPQAEKAYYELHENSLEDEGYRRFLDRCAKPVLARLSPASRGLDFGCGPAPLLARMFEERGHSVSTYDLYFQPDASVLDCRFDFIVSTEVIEHLANPMVVLTRLWHQVDAGGILALMTKLVASPERFASWHYIRDPTHIVFFSVETFHWLAKQLSATVEFPSPDVILLTKPD